MNAENGLSLELGKYQKHINIRFKEMQDQEFVKRLWKKDDSLWMKGNVKSDISALSMGWLNVTNEMINNLPFIEEFCKTIKLEGFTHIVLFGMGGSSLTPLVFQKTFLLKKSNGHTYSFGLLKRAQVIGDREALIKNKRRVILIDLGHDPVKGLNSLMQVIEEAHPFSNGNGNKVKYMAPIPPAFLGRNDYSHGHVSGRMW